jgi:hypothetical protein
MVNKNVILGILPPFQNKQNVILENQNVSDIITGILNTHKKYEKQYDKIYKYFIAENLEKTGKNIFDFLKANVTYFIESNEFQYLKSPASIVSTKGDCKSYALFACGVLDAFARNENPELEVTYRFASYDPFNKTPEHVFCVVKENGKEYWIDPVLDRFNQRKDPYFYKDKKLNSMALVGLSGISNENDQLGAFDFFGGDSTSGGFDWGNLINTAFLTAPSIITATQGKGSGVYNPAYGGYSPTGGGYIPNQYPIQQQSSMNQSTLLMLGVGAIALIFLLKKK